MLNCIINNYYLPETEDAWHIIETNNGFYELRLGGFRKTPSINFDQYERLEETGADTVIKEIWSDDFWLYFILSDDRVISHGQNSIAADGEVSMAITFSNKDEFLSGDGADFFRDDDIWQLAEGPKGYSVRKS